MPYLREEKKVLVIWKWKLRST